MDIKKILIGIGILIVIAAAITNPNVARHQQEAKNLISVLLKESIERDMRGTPEDIEQASREIVEFIETMVLQSLVESSIQRSNFILFSTGNLRTGERLEVVSFGIFGQTFILSSGKEIIVEFYEQEVWL